MMATWQVRHTHVHMSLQTYNLSFMDIHTCTVKYRESCHTDKHQYTEL